MFLSSGKMGNPVDTVNFSINGISHNVNVAEFSNHSLASYVREVAGLTGTKVGISKTNKQTRGYGTAAGRTCNPECPGGPASCTASCAAREPFLESLEHEMIWAPSRGSFSL